MTPDNVSLIPAFGGFLTGAACMWLRSGRVRTELLRTRWAAEHDGLTGLRNRAGARSRYERERRAGRRSALVLLDLDGFKQVNDTFGHQVGDRLLAEVAERLGQVCRPADCPSRLGGDEFLILVSQSIPTDLVLMLQELLSRIAAPFTVDEGAHPPATLACTASAGIATSFAGGTWTTQLQQADIALYHAKTNPGSIVLFEKGMRHPPDVSGGRHRPAGVPPELVGASTPTGRAKGITAVG